jgi:hypothetical protein
VIFREDTAAIPVRRTALRASSRKDASTAFSAGRASSAVAYSPVRVAPSAQLPPYRHLLDGVSGDDLLTGQGARSPRSVSVP